MTKLKTEELQSMPTEELIKLNNKLIERGDDSDVQHTASELFDRQSDDGHRDALKSKVWDELTKTHPRKKAVTKRLIIAAVTIAVLAALTAVTYAAMPEWFRYIFGTDTMTAASSGELFIEDAGAEYRSLEEALTEYSLENLSPSWIPERFSLETVTVSDLGKTVNFFAWYTDSEGDGLSILISYLEDDDLETHASTSEIDGTAEEITIGGRAYYLDTNMSTPTIKWEQNNCLCSITGNVTQKEFKRIIGSIYGY